MARPRHPNKGIEAAVAYAESREWTFAPPVAMHGAESVVLTASEVVFRGQSGQRRGTPMAMQSGSGASSTVARISWSETMPATLKIFRFTLVLSGVSELTDDLANALYEAGCDDAGVGSCDGVVTVEFDREAESKGNAIGSAVVQVENAGFTVARVEVEPASG